MKRIRYYIAMTAAKLSILALKILGRNASYLPGKIALKISKDFIGQLTPPKTVIAVTGTNGKTTVSNLITSILRENGYQVTNNGLGSNVQAGIATILLQNSSFSGKPKNDIAVLEVDERSSLLIYPYLKPDYLVCNNIMRDSLKRNAHTDFISFIINKALPETTKLILNADDMICASLGPNNKDRVYFGMQTEKPDHHDPQFVQDIVYCPKCGGPLADEYIRYNHIGRMYCKSCDFRSPDPNFAVTAIDRAANTFTVVHSGVEHTYNLINDNIVNVYNFCGAIALLTEFGLTYEQISLGFSASKIVKTRYDHFESGDLNITMQLAKGQNPIACARCYSYVSKCAGENKGLIILVDDKGDNIGNSESVCWLYDCDYRYLTDPSIAQIVFAGPRCKDQYLRALIAGVDPAKIKLTEDPKNGASLLDTELSKDVFVLYDPYLLAEASVVKAALIKKGTEGA